MRRLYETVIQEHFRENRQMLFLMGPRQAGKTTAARRAAEGFADHRYLTWDNQSHRRIVLGGPERIAGEIGLELLREEPPLCILDEVHRFGSWKTLLKGLFDTYPDKVRLLVTGSARLDVFKAGGDSLMGRYFPYRLHPVSVAELTRRRSYDELIEHEPRPISDDAWEALLRFGGFPEPFLRAEQRFWRRWRRLRTQQLLREDLRDLSRIQELGQVEVLARLVAERVGQLTSHASMARAVGVSVDTIRRWMRTLQSLYYCFEVRPWHRSITRALRKEPKYYLWDWSQLADPGARSENLVASALLKAVHLWTDHGLGELDLHFVRDKQKREVDFLVSRDGRPWFLVEVKTSSAKHISSSLHHFQQESGAVHAFQVARDLPFVERDCFELHEPVIVPARTLLAQLV